jgi:hypothetical protein
MFVMPLLFVTVMSDCLSLLTFEINGGLMCLRARPIYKFYARTDVIYHVGCVTMMDDSDLRTFGPFSKSDQLMFLEKPTGSSYSIK